MNAAYKLEDKIDAIMEAFYSAVLEENAAGRQKCKRAAIAELSNLISKEEATKKVQRWFDAIREQQRQK